MHWNGIIMSSSGSLPPMKSSARLVVMSGGKVIADGAPKEVFTHVEMLKSYGLTVPDPVLLSWELNKHGFDLPLTALTVEECAQAISREM